MSTVVQRVTVLLTVLAAVAGVHADDRDDFLRLLAARNKSLGDFEVRVRQVTFAFQPQDCNSLREDIEQACAGPSSGQTPAQWVESLVAKWAKEPHRLDRHMIQSGDRFKEVLTRRDSKFEDIDLYDGLFYYSYARQNRQLDIYPTIPPIGHVDLWSLGIALPVPSRDGITALEKNKGDFRATLRFGQGETYSCVVDFHPDLDQYRCRDASSGRGILDETWYLFREPIDGYFVPRVRVNLTWNRRRDTGSVWIYVIENLRLNCPIAEKDLTLGEVPPETLVIDYRFGLSTQWRYWEYCQSAIRAEALRRAAEARDLIEYLDRSKRPRDAASTRDARAGRMAPALEVTNWLQKPPAGLEKWPPGRPVILEFWNISCGPCIASIPENNRLAEWIEGQGGLFLSIHSATHEIPEIQEFLKSHALHYAVGFDKARGDSSYWGSATFAAYGINGIPTCVTIGRSGRVLSYEHLSTQELEKLLAQEPAEVRAGRSTREVRPLTVLPPAWRASDLESNSEVQGRVFLFRPDTPDLTLRTWKGDAGPIQPTWVRHSADGQTVYEIQLKAKAPEAGRTRKGRIGLIAEYDKQEHLVEIPYQLDGRYLVECATPALWFGSVRPGQTITREVLLRLAGQPPARIDVGSMPAGLRVQVQDQSSPGPEIKITVAFSAQESGVHEGTVNLTASDGKGNKHPLPLGYCAFVQP